VAKDKMSIYSGKRGILRPAPPLEREVKTQKPVISGGLRVATKGNRGTNDKISIYVTNILMCKWISRKT
jgi:hypothetical protein